MNETKVQIGEDVLLDIGTHSDWYISAVGYNGESVDVVLRRKADRNKEWWLADTPQTDTHDLRTDTHECVKDTHDKTSPNSSEKPNNCEELNAYRKCVESRSFWDNKHCDGCYFDERCPFDEPKDEPTISKMEQVDEPQTEREGE